MTLDSIAERAQRQLDGMTVNRDAFCRDVLALVAAIRAARARAPTEGQPKPGFAEAFDDVFKGIFK